MQLISGRLSNIISYEHPQKDVVKQLFARCIASTNWIWILVRSEPYRQPWAYRSTTSLIGGFLMPVILEKLMFIFE